MLCIAWKKLPGRNAGSFFWGYRFGPLSWIGCAISDCARSESGNAVRCLEEAAERLLHSVQSKTVPSATVR